MSGGQTVKRKLTPPAFDLGKTTLQDSTAADVERHEPAFDWKAGRKVRFREIRFNLVQFHGLGSVKKDPFCHTGAERNREFARAMRAGDEFEPPKVAGLDHVQQFIRHIVRRDFPPKLINEQNLAARPGGAPFHHPITEPRERERIFFAGKHPVRIEANELARLRGLDFLDYAGVWLAKAHGALAGLVENENGSDLGQDVDEVFVNEARLPAALLAADEGHMGFCGVVGANQGSTVSTMQSTNSLRPLAT